MNKLEQKCALMAQTPQSRWYDLRFKPVIQLLNNMITNGEFHGVVNIPSPFYSMMGIQVSLFKYSGSYYLLFVGKNGNIYDNFHLETPNINYLHAIASHIVLSSDDDPKQDTYLPYLAITLGVKNNQELILKFKSYYGE